MNFGSLPPRKDMRTWLLAGATAFAAFVWFVTAWVLAWWEHG